MRLKTVKEGKVELKVPEGRKYDVPVFFNPEAELQRDMSVSVLQVWNDMAKPLSVLDALSATGVRGLRYAKEVGGLNSVTLNDKNPVAFKLIKQNIELNSCEKCEPRNEDANLLMRENVFQVIDIDPFGSPNLFMDSAARSIFHKGFLAVTATDTAPLCGAYPDACFRKYGIRSIKGTDYYAELGMRILISFTILSLARRDRAFVPLLSHASKHYFRVYGKMGRASQIKGLLEKFAFVMHCPECGNRKTGKSEPVCSCGAPLSITGPVYLGPILEKDFCSRVFDDLKGRDFRQKPEELKLLNLLMEEAELPPLYYDLHYLAKKQGLKIPKIDFLIKRLKRRGFRAGRTHFCPTAVKTDASFGELKKLMKA